MQKSKIEWTDYTLNPIKGLCPVDCKDNQGKSYCYARRMYKRFKWNPEIRFDNRAFSLLEQIKKPSRIFIGSTMELFGEWVGADAANYIFRQVRNFPQHTFIFLTKCPQNLSFWSPFPRNCWIGCSVTNHEQLIKAQVHLAEIKGMVKFVSIEPMLEELDTLVAGYWLGLFESVDWAILGARTQPTRYPKPETVKLVLEIADYSHIPVFVKSPLAEHLNIHRQEYPLSQQGR